MTVIRYVNIPEAEWKAASDKLARLTALLEPLRDLSDEAAQAPWKATNAFDGSDWLVCSLGNAQDGNDWHVTTDGVHASELRGGPAEEAKLIAAARNAIAEMLRVIS